MIFVVAFLVLRIGDKPLLKGGGVLALLLTKRTRKLRWHKRSGPARRALTTLDASGPGDSCQEKIGEDYKEDADAVYRGVEC